MSEITPLTYEERRAIGLYLPLQDSHGLHVTLTYAQSLDSMISLGRGQQTVLSGSQSKSMTHYLRLHHDAILVGAGTFRTDNPSLNCRYPGVTLETQPRPIIIANDEIRDNIDNSKVAKLAAEGKGLVPWTVAADDYGFTRDGSYRWDALEEHLAIGTRESMKMDWKVIFKALWERGIKSVMVEGGAGVINELLETPNLVSTTIVTIAPVWLGKWGVQVAPTRSALVVGNEATAGLVETTWHQFGPDMVVCGKLVEGSGE